MEALPFLQGRPVSPTRVRMFLASFAACGFALFASSWKLWTPQQVFPQVPLFAWLIGTPALAQWIAFVVMGVSLLFVGFIAWQGKPVLGGRSGMLLSVALLTFAVATIFLFLVDQHRLQPWAYQLVIFAIVLAVLPGRRAFVLLRLIVVSIYVWSALAKLDYSFVDSLGQQFLGASLGLFGMSCEHWSPTSRHAAALAFPMVELVIAAGLCLPLARWTYARRIVLTIAIVMHALLILVLGPLGLNHQPAVILWNVWFIAQALLLFGFPTVGRALLTVDEDAADKQSPLWRELSAVVVEFLVAAVIILPVLNLIDRYDHWLAWGLYAPRNSRATLYIQDSVVQQLPAELVPYVDAPASAEGWRQLRIDQWSLDTLSVPLYPQDRFQIGVAEAVIQRYELQNGFQLVVEPPAERWTGHRQRITLRNLRELESHSHKLLFNSKPATR